MNYYCFFTLKAQPAAPEMETIDERRPMKEYKKILLVIADMEE